MTEFSLNQENLQNCFDVAEGLKRNYVGVLIRMKDYSKDEIIINPKENFKDKAAYYNHAYDNDLYHKHADGVRIVGFTYGDTFAEIEKDLIR